jgi:hypothetical protein
MVTTPVGVKATSMIIDSSGRFAYILSNDPDNTVSSYRVNPDGSLAAISKIGAGGAAGVVGGYSLATTPLQPVNIDIRPNVPDPATINIDPEDDGDKRATVAVAILSNDAFDAVTEIDRSSLTFGHSGDENSLASCTSRTLVQVDQVARRGLLCNFVVRRTAFQLGDSTGVLKGRTIHNVPLRGTDAVRIVLVKDE